MRTRESCGNTRLRLVFSQHFLFPQTSTRVSITRQKQRERVFCFFKKHKGQTDIFTKHFQSRSQPRAGVLGEGAGGAHTPPPPPWDDLWLSRLIQLRVFTFGHQSVSSFLSGAPPPRKILDGPQSHNPRYTSRVGCMTLRLIGELFVNKACFLTCFSSHWFQNQPSLALKAVERASFLNFKLEDFKNHARIKCFYIFFFSQGLPKRAWQVEVILRLKLQCSHILMES